jgi:hypothetical protein
VDSSDGGALEAVGIDAALTEPGALEYALSNAGGSEVGFAASVSSMAAEASAAAHRASVALLLAPELERRIAAAGALRVALAPAAANAALVLPMSRAHLSVRASAARLDGHVRSCTAT